MDNSSTCDNCGTLLTEAANFCGGCGIPVTKAQTAPMNNLLVSIGYFFAILVLNIIIYYSVDFYTFQTDVVASICFIVVTIAFAIILKKPFTAFLSGKLNFALGVISIVAAVLVAVVVSQVANWLNLELWEVEYLEVDIYLDTTYPFLYAMIFTAIIPAVFEEWAFRGFMFSEIKKFSNTETAWIITSVLFAFLHLSIIGLLWYIPLGFLLGYLRLKYNNITYCVIAHFFYNFMIIALDFNKYFTEW